MTQNDVNEEKKQIGQRIKRVRLALHLSQKELAKGIFVSAAFLSEVESGKNKPGFDFLKNLSKTFRVNLNYLVHGEGNQFVRDEPALEAFPHEADTPLDTLEQVFWYSQRSPLVKNLLRAYGIKLIYDYQHVIKKDLAYFYKKKSEPGNDANNAENPDNVDNVDTADKGESIDKGGKI